MFEHLSRPTLLIDKQKCLRNIEQMAQKAKDNRLHFRPHFKTHQSAEVGEWFRKSGVDSIAVSSVEMAEYFANAGWQDITIAFSLNVHELPAIDKLAENRAINILIENTDVFPFIEKKLRNDVGFFIKIDAGYHRTGASFNNTKLIDSILNESQSISQLKFKGFVIHAGNTYNAKSTKEILDIHAETLLAVDHLKQIFCSKYPEMIVSIGDTPSCSLSDNFEGVDELRPGNFVYYDAMQYYLGSCKLDDIAVCVACPVVAIHHDRNEIVIHGGAVHLSKESIEVDGKKIFGIPVRLTDTGWEPLHQDHFVKSLSQEHGIIKFEGAEIEEIAIGNWVGILPIHSCLTANLLSRFQVIE